MIGLVFVILFALSFPCEGQINLQSKRDTFYVLKGSNVEIAWTFNVTILLVRTWRFVEKNELLASIIQEQGVMINQLSSLSEVNVTKPATLVLKNVDISYNGTYSFTITANENYPPSYATVFVLAQPNVTIGGCSNLTIVDEGENVTCPCTSEGGNPPANVTWYKNGKKTEKKDEENRLTLTNVTGADNGTYTCVAQSYILKVNESFVLKVIPNFAPVVKSVLPSEMVAVLGKSFTITCVASGHPAPTYIIKHNDKVVSPEKTTNKYTISTVNDSHAGSYECIAKNKLGESSKTFNLTVIAPTTKPTTTATPTSKPGNKTGTPSTSTTSSNKTVGPPEKTDDDDGPSPGLIAGIVIGAILFLLIIVFLIWWFKYREEKSGGEHIGNDVVPGNQGNAPVPNENAYESLPDGEGKKPENLYDEARLGNDNGGAGSTSDTLPPVYATVDKDKKKNKKKDKKKNEPAPENTPPVYATVDKTRHNEPSVTYATLDTVAMQPTGSSKRDRRDQPTEYASIAEFGVKGDLV